jgi:YD repeat-containing protein
VQHWCWPQVPAFAQTTFYNPDGSVAQAATGTTTHVRRGNVQYTYDSNGKLQVRTRLLGNVAKLYDAKGYLGTAVTGPNGTTIRFRSGNRVWTPTVKDFR